MEMREMKDSVQELVTKVSDFCIGKKLYGLLIECLCLFEDGDEE